MNRNSWLDEVQRNLSDLIARSPAADLQRNAKAMMTDAFSRMDLVTREEFDVQTELLARTRAKLDALEAQLRRLEGQDSTPSATPAPTNPAAAMGAFTQSAAASAATTPSAGAPPTPASSNAPAGSTPAGSTSASSATSSILTPAGVPFGAGSSGATTPPAGNTGSAPVSSPSPSSTPASGTTPASNPPKEGDLAM